MAEDSTIANLDKVDHIVVLMMENRSFDHMLGYLSLEGGRADVDGIPAGFTNEYAGRRCTTSPASCATWTPMACHGAGIPSTSAH